MPSVFVSYSHDPANPEHSHNVLRLAASLMRDGLTVFIDQNRGDDEEKIPWPIWMEDRIESADYVLLVCTELYWNKVRQKVPNDVGQGVCWEANLIYNALYENKLNTIKFVPVVFTDSERKFIPSPLKGATSFLLDSPLGYKRLFAFLTGQHRRRFPKQGAQLPIIAEELVEPMFPPPDTIASPGPSGVEKTKKTAAALQGSFARAEEAARFIENQTAFRPRIALLLGTAFDKIADRLTEVTTVKYETIPHFPHVNRSSRVGHLIIGKLADVPLTVLCGRLHHYEGLGLDAVVFPIRILARMGICSLVFTSAAAGINPAFTPGSLVLLSDHINLLGSNPMVGSSDERLGSRFADMSEVYNRRYREIARSSAENLGFSLLEGVFAGHTGPSYETSAEVRSLRNQGADLVGMSVVPEVIAARHLGIRVLATCAITNIAAGVETQQIAHNDVLSFGQQLPGRLTALLECVIPRIAAEL